MKINKKNLLSLFLVFGLFTLAYFFMPQTAHAQSLHDDLTYHTSGQTAWIFTIWKVMLGIANVIVVVFLLFLAAVNILHLQYDTYQIKKSLPLLIGGAIAANFSILICRMIVDAAQVLTASFAGNPQKLVSDYLQVFMINPTSAVGTTGLVTVMVGTAIPIIIVTLLIIAIAICVLAFLLWIRKIVIFFLVAVSPVAFILYAFPPTQGIFKQWWSQFLKWAFMGPILMIALWGGSMIGASRGNSPFSFSAALAVIFLTIVAGMVPFKLGGAVMGAWGNLGKKASMMGKDGLLRKPIDAGIQRKKDRVSTNLANRFAGTKLGKFMDAGRAADENAIENAKGLRESKYQSRMGEHMEKNKDRQKVIDREIEQGKNTIENLRMKLKLELESGDLGNISDKALAGITGQKGANQASTLARYEKQNSDMNDYKNALEKERAEKLVLGSNEKIRDNKIVRSGLKQMAATGQTVKSEYEKDGTKRAPGSAPVEMHWGEAMDTAEQIDFDATKLKGQARQDKLDAANHIRSQANQFSKSNTTYAAGTMINGASVAGQKIDYDSYLSRNLAGRQMKTEAPFIADEGKTLQMSNTHKALVADTKKEFGTGRFRSDNVKFNKTLVGKGHEVESGASVANQAQLRGIALNLVSMDRGDVIGIESAQDLMHRVNEAQTVEHLTDPSINVDFLQTKSKAALDKTATLQSNVVKTDILTQHNNKPRATQYTSYADLEASTDHDAALETFDISRLDCNSSDPDAAARRAYLDSLKTELLTDENLGLSNNPAAMAATVDVP